MAMNDNDRFANPHHGDKVRLTFKGGKPVVLRYWEAAGDTSRGHWMSEGKKSSAVWVWDAAQGEWRRAGSRGGRKPVKHESLPNVYSIEEHIKMRTRLGKERMKMPKARTLSQAQLDRMMG